MKYIYFYYFIIKDFYILVLLKYVVFFSFCWKTCSSFSLILQWMFLRMQTWQFSGNFPITCTTIFTAAVNALLLTLNHYNGDND